jgi:Kef-type K+ transport system membrane component KefB/Trk K+ transport system NAD-binding subunit
MDGSIIHHLAIVLLACACTGLLLKVLRLPLVPAYILTGLLLKTEVPLLERSLLDDPRRVEIISELGLLLLMFTLGLEFSVRKLRSLGTAPYLTGVGECLAMTIVVALAARALGLDPAAAWAMGAVLAFSSTTVIVKTSQEMRLNTQPYMGQVMGTLIVEDLLAVFAIVALPRMAAGLSPEALLPVAAILLASILGWWFLGSILAPPIVRRAVRSGGNELLVLLCVGLALCLGLAFEALHLSAALGAFLMGSILADTREIRRIHNVVEPVKNIFVALFFCAFGMQLELGLLAQNTWAILAFAPVVYCGKVVFVALFAILAGHPLGFALKMGLTMSQVGEFSLVLVAIAERAGLLTADHAATVMGVCLLSILLSPIEMKKAPALADWIEGRLPARLRRFIAGYTAGLKDLSLNRYPGRRLGQGSESQIKLFAGIRRIARQGQSLYRRATRVSTSSTLERLAPWDEYLAEVVVEPGSIAEGQTLLCLQLRDRVNVNVVAVEREQGTFVAPDPNLTFYPGDHVLLYGTSEAIERAQDIFSFKDLLVPERTLFHLPDCELRAIALGSGHLFIGQTLAEIRLRELYQCLILAVLRTGNRIKNPPSSFRCAPGDLIYVVGPKPCLATIAALRERAAADQGGADQK